MKAFLNNICLRESCYNCFFKKMIKASDITLADYWGINNIHPEMFDNKGVSLVIVNTEKGQQLFDAIKKNTIFVETNLKTAINYNKSIIESVAHNKKEVEFDKNIDKIDIEKLINRCVPQASFLKRAIIALKNKFNIKERKK